MNGARIKIAGKKEGLSLRGLADRMGGVVSAQAIGKYERGEMSPSSEVLLALCKALDVSLFYLNAPQAVELGAVEFRTRSTTTAKERARVETEVLEWIERYLQIEEILEIESGVWECPPRYAPASREPRRGRSLGGRPAGGVATWNRSHSQYDRAA